MSTGRCFAIVCVLFLTACASNDSKMAMPPDPPASVDLEPTLDTALALFAANRAATFDAAAAAASSLLSPDVISTVFDGQALTVSIPRPGANALAFDTQTDTIFSSPPLPLSPVPGHVLGYWTLLAPTPEGATISAHFISWDNADHTDYLAAGYWLHLTGLTGEGQSLEFESAEAGVFMDGPELSVMTPPALPSVGQAVYAGPSQGFYVGKAGPNPLNPEVAPGSTEVGRFDSTIRLTADFGEHMVTGCMGCQLAPGQLEGFRVNELVFVDGATGESIQRGERILPYVIRLEAAFSEDEVGSFGSNQIVSVETVPTSPGVLPPGFEISSSGSWGGRFSNVQEAGGEPRLLAGRVGVSFQTSGGGEGTVLGTFVGLPPQAQGPGM